MNSTLDEESRKKNQKKNIGCLLLGLLILFAVVILIGKIKEQNQVINESPAVDEPVTEIQNSNVYKPGTLEDLKQYASFDYAICDNNKESALEKLNWLYQQQLKLLQLKTVANDVKSLTKSLDSLQEKYNAIQAKAFPYYRKAFFTTMKEKLWEENVDVAIFGDRNENLILTSAAFANHKVIKSSYETLRGMLYDLRFKRIKFEWYDGATDGTTYETDCLTDNDPCRSLGAALK